MCYAVRFFCALVLATWLNGAAGQAAPLDGVDYQTSGTFLDPHYDSQFLNQRGIDHVGRREFDAALSAFNAAIKNAPKFPEPYNNRGTVRHVLKQYDLAVADFQEYLKLEPNSAKAHINLGNSLLALGKAKDALAAFHRAVELDDDDGRAYYARGLAHKALGNDEQSRRDFEQALRLEPAFQIPQPPQQTSPAQQWDAASLSGLVPRYSGSRGRPQAQKIDAYLADLNDAIASDELDAKLWIDRGAAHCEHGDYERAIEDLNRACTLAPQNPLAFYNRGVALYELGKVEEALSDFYETLRLAPDDVPAYFGRAMVWQKSGHHGRALVDYQEVLRRVPIHPVALINRAWILATAPQSRHRDGQQAVAAATRACELTRWEMPGFVDTLAAACAESGDFARAVEFQEKALKQLGDSATEEMNQRLVLYQQSKPYRDAAR